jgi:hypothetical protein
MIWKKFKWFGKKNQRTSQKAKSPEIKFLEPEENPWKVRLLDVGSINAGLTLWSTDRQCAENAASIHGEDGIGFIGVEPPDARQIETNLRFKTDGMLFDGVLYAPLGMDQKWAIYYHQNKIIFVQSWYRKVQVTANVRQDDKYIKLTSIKGTFLNDLEDSEQTKKVANYLIQSHALNIPFPAPLPIGMDDNPEEAASWCMSCFGDLVTLATSANIPYSVPDKPLRSNSMLHISVARGDETETRRLLDSGVPINLLSADGRPPLHWALARQDTKMAELLLKKGSSVDVRSEEGATPLMIEVQNRNNSNVIFLLDQGADPNASDNRGFTSLHRAADMGELEMTKTLLSRGAEVTVEAEGHSPISFAESRGNSELVELLKKNR